MDPIETLNSQIDAMKSLIEISLKVN
jgi:hypothetical protein